MKEYIAREIDEGIIEGEELIRCENCKHWLPPQYGVYGLCDFMHDELRAKMRNGYCDEAVRKEK